MDRGGGSPAPISTSSPAAAGWRRTRVPADRSAGAASTSCRSATTTTLRQHPRDAGRSRRRRRTPKKIGDYYASCMDESAINAKGAAPLEPLLKKIAALTGATRSGRRSSPSCTPSASTPFFSFGAEADFKDASWRCAIADQGGTRPARSRLLLPRRREVGGAAQAVRRARRQDGGAARRPRRHAAAAAAST